MKITRINKGDWGKTKAFFDLEVEGFTIKGFTIVDGVNGLFVGMPSVKKDDEYFDTVWANKELKDKLKELAVAAYGQEDPIITEEQPVVATETAQTEVFDDEDIPF